jgi:hypothetical protein
VAIYISGFLCQYALEEPDHSITAVRICDQIISDLPSDVPPEKINIVNFLAIWVLLFVKSDGPEDFDMAFTGIAPNGDRVNPCLFNVRTEGGSKGHQIRTSLNIDPRSVGLWWFEVAAKGTVVLKMPLQVAAHDASQTSSQQPSSEAS